jgi:hypothetical protein
MKQILHVSPLTPIEAAQMRECEKSLGISRGVYEQRQREYLSALETLKKKYDEKYAEHSKQTMAKYTAQVIDNCVVVSLE